VVKRNNSDDVFTIIAWVGSILVGEAMLMM
jgi:hypothetical protein